MQKHRRATPKGSQPSRLEQKVAADNGDTKQLAVWRKKVWVRDGPKCRNCRVHCKRLSIKVLDPRRGECHHVWRRDELETRYDVRNGLLLCLLCHQQVTGVVRLRLEIVGTAWFRSKTDRSRRYINANKPVTFRKIA